MDDYFLIVKKRLGRFFDPKGRRKGGGFKGVKATKINILILINLVLGMGLFFSILFEKNAYAFQEKNNSKPKKEVVDPLAKIGKEKIILGKVNSKNVCLEDKDSKKNISKKEDVKNNEKMEEIREIVSGSPMEKMLPSICEKDDRVAAFLIGIAKKESDFGFHSPRKNGRDCYNYWGFKGGYNPVAGGYSCFDSPEQAVAEVGRKIEQLVSKKVDTPERMVVWKCGSSCAGHDPGSVRSWIGTVRTYYNRLAS